MPENKLENCLLSPAAFPEKYTKNIALISYCQLCINYKSNKHIMKIKKSKSKSKYSSHQLQLKAYNILLQPMFKANFCTP